MKLLQKLQLKKIRVTPEVNDETLSLYQRIGAILQSLVDRRGQNITQKFGTVNPKMKAFMKNKGAELGFKITEAEKDKRTLKAQRNFTPRK